MISLVYYLVPRDHVECLKAPTRKSRPTLGPRWAGGPGGLRTQRDVPPPRSLVLFTAPQSCSLYHSIPARCSRPGRRYAAGPSVLYHRATLLDVSAGIMYVKAPRCPYCQARGNADGGGR